MFCIPGVNWTISDKANKCDPWRKLLLFLTFSFSLEISFMKKNSRENRVYLKIQANCEQICWPPSCIRLMGGWACPVIGSSYSTAVGDKLWLEKYRPLLSWSDGWVCFAGPVVAVHGLGWHPLCHALIKTRLGGLNQASQCTFLRKSGMNLFQYKWTEKNPFFAKVSPKNRYALQTLSWF